MLKYQINWSDDFKNIIWQKIIKSKITNQYAVLEILNSSEKSLNLLNTYIDTILPGDTSNREGHSAKVYFNNIFDEKFKRDQDGLDIINSGLNYGYSLIRAYIARLCVGYGLVCMIGVHHKSEYNNFNLVDDLIEPFRPFIDILVYKFIKDSLFFKKEHRILLIDILNMKIFYNKKNILLSSAIDIYVYSFKNAMETNNLDEWEMPIIENFEVLRNEV